MAAVRIVGEVVHDHPPRREPVLTPGVGRDDALVGTSAHAVGDPLGQIVVVGLRPPAVDLEPRVRVSKRLLSSRGLGVQDQRPDGRFSFFFACLSARFSLSDLPAFLLFDFFGDLSATGTPRL
jgi:hypothetical protein